MKKLLVLGALLLPSIASAHGGHASTNIVADIFHIEHVLLYVAPVLMILLPIALMKRKEINMFLREKRNRK